MAHKTLRHLAPIQLSSFSPLPTPTHFCRSETSSMIKRCAFEQTVCFSWNAFSPWWLWSKLLFTLNNPRGWLVEVGWRGQGGVGSAGDHPPASDLAPRGAFPMQQCLVIQAQPMDCVRPVQVFPKSGCLGMQPKVGGKLHLRLNNSNKYCKGKLKRAKQPS